MGSALLEVLPIALGAAISPILLLLQVATLASGRHALVRSFCVLAGTVVVTAAVMAVVVVADHATTGGAGPGDPVVTDWIEVVLGVVLAAGGVRILISPREAASAPSPTTPDDRVHAVRSVLLGVAAMVTNLTSIVLLIPATHRAWTAPLPTGQRVLLLAVVGVVTLLPASLPPLLVVALGRRGPVVLSAMSGALHRHQRTITALVALGFAAVFLVKGLRGVG